MVHEMKKYDNTNFYKHANIFALCSKRYKDRSDIEANAIAYYLRNKVKFFEAIDNEKLNAVTSKIET